MKFSVAGDRTFILLATILVLGGLAVFFSASLGFLARETAPSISRMALTQLGVGLGAGFLTLVILARLPYRLLKRLPVPLYIFGIAVTALVFVPGLGANLNGATRWIDLGFTTVQPAEFLKLGTPLMLAWWLARERARLADIRKGLLPLIGFLALPALILLAQPNTSTFIVLSATALAMYFVAGAPWRDLLIIVLIAAIGASALVATRPYLRERVLTFVNPMHDPFDTSYQIQQSLLAVGSGGLTGRGFGQSVQKFNYLPEPAGDSIFAVYAEEMGFIGAAGLNVLFILFAARGIAIAANASDLFGGLAAFGLSVSIVFQAFVNIGAMLGLFPLTGLPLPFASHGGTALLTTLAAVGIILNISSRKRV